jgi:DNA-binding GntR family transcriptional regulator
MKNTPSAPPSRQLLADRIYQQVHERIADGAIDPAHKLTESRLAAMLGVSRTPLRAALVRLRREGLLTGTGTGAARPMVSLGLDDLEEILEIRLLVEPYIAARAASRPDTGGLERLRRALEREAAATALRSAREFTIANHHFRVALFEMAGNHRLAETASRYDSQIHFLRRLTLTGRANRETVVASHQRLVQAIGAGQAEQAENEMRQLLVHARQSAVDLLNKRRPARPKE